MTDFLATAQVRSATRADLPAIISLLADDVLGTARESTDPNDLPVYERAFDAMTAQGGNEYLVVEREGQLLAVMQFTVIPGLSRRGRTRALLEGVRVSSACRGQGVGERFLGIACGHRQPEHAVVVRPAHDVEFQFAEGLANLRDGCRLDKDRLQQRHARGRRRIPVQGAHASRRHGQFLEPGETHGLQPSEQRQRRHRGNCPATAHGCAPPTSQPSAQRGGLSREFFVFEIVGFHAGSWSSAANST